MFRWFVANLLFESVGYKTVLVPIIFVEEEVYIKVNKQTKETGSQKCKNSAMSCRMTSQRDETGSS